MLAGVVSRYRPNGIAGSMSVFAMLYCFGLQTYFLFLAFLFFLLPPFFYLFILFTWAFDAFI